MPYGKGTPRIRRRERSDDRSESLAIPTKPTRPPGVPSEANWTPNDSGWELANRDLELRRQGIVRRWRTNGTKQSEYNFNDDRIDGPFRRWHDSGQLAREGVAASGKVVGWDRSYRSSEWTSESSFPADIGPSVHRIEHLYEEGIAIRFRYFLNDGTECEISGEPFPPRPADATPNDSLTWSPGLCAWYSELSEGTGIERNWSRDGKLLKSSECVKGKRHGKTVLYRDDRMRKNHRVFDHPAFAVTSVVRIEGHFDSGRPIGWDFFDALDNKVELSVELGKQKAIRRTTAKQ
jgi:antitoxin component YwqK of YwqJK toxin-antitoxin module